MPLCNNLIEVFRLGGAEGREAEVINDQEIWGKIPFDPPLPGVVSPTCQEKAEEFNGFGKEDIVSQTAGLMAKGLGDVSLSHSSRAVKENMFSSFDEATVSQVPDEFPIELWIEREVESFDRLFFFKGGPHESEVESLCLPSLDLVLDHELEKLHVSEGGALGLLKSWFEAFQETSEMEGLELSLEMVVEIHETTSFLGAKYSGALRKLCPRGDRGIATLETVFSGGNHPFSSMVLMLR